MSTSAGPGFISFDDIISAVTVDGKQYAPNLMKLGPTAKAAGSFIRLWGSNGTPGAGREPPPTLTITAATTATPIVCTTATHGLTTGDTVNITGGTGMTAINGDWTIIVLSGTTFSLTGSVGAGTYTGSSATVNGTKYISGLGSVNFADQGPKQKYLLSWEATATQDCTIFVYDRLSAVGGISVASTGNKTLVTPALPRYTDGVGVEAWLEYTTAGTSTTPVYTLNNYTGSINGASQTGPALSPAIAAPTASYAVQFPLAAGDTGVVSVQGFNVGTAATAGVVNLVLRKKIASLPLLANQTNFKNLIRDIASMPRIFDGASLEFLILASTTTAPNAWPSLNIGYN